MSTIYKCLFFDDIDENKIKMLENIYKTTNDITVILRLNIHNFKKYEKYETIMNSFETKIIFAPIICQMYNKYIYIILKSFISDKIKYSIQIELKNIMNNYIINNKIFMMYLKSTYGHKYIWYKYLKNISRKI